MGGWGCIQEDSSGKEVRWRERVRYEMATGIGMYLVVTWNTSAVEISWKVILPRTPSNGVMDSELVISYNPSRLSLVGWIVFC